MSRTNAQNYCGARSRITLDKARELGAQWVLQPKVDGCYCTVHLDDAGEVSRIVSRTGREFDDATLVRRLLGIKLGWPGAVLAGELEAHTEWARKTVADRQWRNVHLFDMVHSAGGRPLEFETYAERRDLLQRMIAEVAASDYGEPVWWADKHGRIHHRETGRYCIPVPRSYLRFPVVEQKPVTYAGQMWADHVADVGGEGLVAVNLNSRIGSRGAKLKIKDVQTWDGVIESVAGKRCSVRFGRYLFAVGVGKHRLTRGDVVEFACDGWYHSGITPRFPRILRRRDDLRANPKGNAQ